MRKANWRLSRCCTVRNCTAFVIPSSEQRSSLRRVHGLQLPLHPQQVVGWIALFGIAVGTFTVVLPYLGPNLQPFASALIGATFSLHVAAHLVALLLDPADPKVRAQSSKKIVPEFDRTKHLHVIENGRCHLCNINTTNKRTKHCSICNKCIEKFDHHCKWLNNCIGGRNYPAFIVCVITAVISALVVAGLSVTEIAIVNIDSSILTNWHVKMDNVTLPMSQSPPGTGSLIVISLVGILSAIAAALLIHLCFFHGYIACLGLTTYEYVRNKRERKIAKGVSSSEDRGSGDQLRSRSCGSFTCNENNADDKRVRYLQSENNKSISGNDYNDSNERSVYICSTHQRQSCGDGNGDQGRRKERRNFHLYFSYETRDSETSIEVSSQTILNGDIDERRQEPIEFKPSTPSPVSCCFSIINAKSTSKQKDVEQKANSEAGRTTAIKERGARSCLTMRRIQSFLRTRLRRNSRARSLNGAEPSRSRKNKVNPATTSDNDFRDEESPKSPISTTSSGTCRDDKPTQSRPPLKLPPLVLPARHKMKQISSTIDLPISNPVVIPAQKRSQPPLRIRRTSFYKRPRFKMGPHVTETAQLSPIPESEFSKPASPRTPPQINHFPFPPAAPSNGMKFNDTNARENH